MEKFNESDYTWYAIRIRSDMTDSSEWILSRDKDYIEDESLYIYETFRDLIGNEDITSFEDELRDNGFVVFYDEDDIDTFEYDRDYDEYYYEGDPINVVSYHHFRY